jgi:O-antigen/teichoic acid export membrane protein
MIKFLNQITTGSIFKNLGILVSGTIIAQLIVIVFQILLRRIYTPEDFGAFAVYMSIVGIAATIASLRYEQAVILPPQPNAGQNLLKLSIILAFVFSIVLFLFFLFFNNQLIKITNFPVKYINWLYIIPLSVFVFSISQSLNFYLIREKLFKTSSSNKVIRRVTEGFFQTVTGKIGYSAGLFIGDLAGQTGVIIRSLLKIKKSDFSFKFYFAGIKNAAIRYKDFPVKNGIPALLNSLSLLLPVIIINSKFSSEITGYFDLARMILIIPLSLITASMSQVLLQNFTEKRNSKKSIAKSTAGTFVSLLIISVFFILIIKLFGTWLFGFVFGDKWNDAGIYASLMVWAFALKFVVSPFNIVFTVFEKIGILSIWQIFYFILITLLYFFKFDTIIDLLKFYVLVEIVSYMVAAILNIFLIIKYETSIKK